MKSLRYFYVNSKLGNLHRRLTELTGSQNEAERRRSRLLAALQVTLILLVSIAFIMTLIFNPAGSEKRIEYCILISALAILLAVMYLLNLAGRYLLSARLTVLLAFSGPWLTIALDPSILSGDLFPMVYMTLSIFLCSLLLSVRSTAIFATIQLIALLALIQFSPARTTINWPSLVTFIIFTSILSILVSSVNQRDMRTIEQQTSQMRESAMQLQSILDNYNAVITLKDINGNYLLVNRQFETLFRVSRKDLVNKLCENGLPPELTKLNVINDQKVIQTKQTIEIEETIKLADGIHTYLSVKFPLFTVSGEVSAICNISTDITLNKQVENALREQSVRDPLTGLFNRRYLEETLVREIKRETRSQKPIGVLMLDIDNFKIVIDTHGHASGDAMLRAFGIFLIEHLRGGDIACRYGGDEFVILLPEASLINTKVRAEQLRQDFRQFFSDQEWNALPKVSLSLGVSMFPEHGTTGVALLNAADKALYCAKKDGRDRVKVAKL
ncbi:MAG: hypothetical protein C0401_09035 [Anaerolinea sp.]|nr:hypothetical protein [Anaerolinea sp.]